MKTVSLSCIVVSFFLSGLLSFSCKNKLKAGNGIPGSDSSAGDTVSEYEGPWSLRYLYHFEDGKDSLRLLVYYGKETSMNYHRLEETRTELQRKRKTSGEENDSRDWEIIQVEQSVESDHDTLRFLGVYGEYIVFENEGRAVYSGGYFDHYLNYIVIRNQKILGATGFSAIVEHNNHATSECIQSLDQNNGCDCINTFGVHKLYFDAGKHKLRFEFQEKREWGVDGSCKDTSGMGVVDFHRAECEGDSCREL